MTKELDEFSWHEALDRARLLADIFESRVQEHPVVDSKPELAQLAGAISDRMGELYQLIGALTAREFNP